MIISLNWLKELCDKSNVVLNATTDELVELIGARLVEVEKILNRNYEQSLAVVLSEMPNDQRKRFK